MKTFGKALLCGVVLTILASTSISAQKRTVVESRFANVNGVRLHYLIAGHGPAIILIHGHHRCGGH
jgi:hypothetical protein